MNPEVRSRQAMLAKRIPTPSQFRSRCTLLSLTLVATLLPFSRIGAAVTGDDWFDFDPATELDVSSATDLRFLNEKVAGQDGYVTVHDGHFTLGSGKPVRFWAVNGPAQASVTYDQLRHDAHLLARYGVNLMRVHGPLYDENGTLDPARIQQRITIAEAMRDSGIYVHYSIYFPLWLKPEPDIPFLEGYNGEQHPFAALMFNKAFQDEYRSWWRALLLTPSERTGERLIDDPSVFGIEVQNEDSFFFWSFNSANVPEPQRAIIEGRFANWLLHKYGSFDAAYRAWNSLRLPQDQPAANRIALRPLADIFTHKTPRDQDTADFLAETQRDFYIDQIHFLRDLGFKGLITCSNWTTANQQVFGPLEKYTYTVGDFVDRHGYFGIEAHGEFVEWSIRDGHTYRDRSAYRFDRPDREPGRLFVHPAMDIKYAGLPSMISETTWVRPNRFRSEAPLYYATYGALQDSDAVVHFAFDGDTWSVKPNYWMQQWTLMSPAMMGQFPAAALIYREGLIATGREMASINLNLTDLLALKGTPMPQDESLDDLRKKEVTGDGKSSADEQVDPLIHYVGRTSVRFSNAPTQVDVADLSDYIDHQAGRVSSSTRELSLDYARGVLRINAPRAQGISGLIGGVGRVDLRDISVESPLELGHIVLVPLDDQPIASSHRMLLQVMSEEKTTGFEVEEGADGLKTILSIGTDPWRMKKLEGRVTFKGAPGNLRVTALDLSGRPTEAVPLDRQHVINLQPTTVYYLIERP